MSRIQFDQKIALFINGKQITKYIYDWAKESNGIVCMGNFLVMDVYDSENGKLKFGISDVDNAEITENCIIVYSKNKASAYSYEGKRIIEPKYTHIYNRNEYYIVKDKKGQKGVFKYSNNSLKEIIKLNEFRDIRLYDSGILVVKKNDNNSYVGLYSYEGDELIPPVNRELNFSWRGIYAIRHNGDHGFFNYTGKDIVPSIYTNIKIYDNCFITCVKDGDNIKYGLYNSDGKQVLKAIYDSYKISMPFVHFYKNGLQSLYNLTNGKRVMSLKYKDIFIYYNVISASDDGKNYSLYSSESGKILTCKLYDNIKIYDQGVLLLETKYGFNMFYLVEHKAFLNAITNDVYYNKDEKRIYIKARYLNENEGGVWKPYIKEC